MDWKTTATISATVLLAVAGYVYNLRLAQRKDRLERVNRQLSDFYGPLFALTLTSGALWELFRYNVKPDTHYFFDERYPPTAKQEEQFRLWMMHVFMPLHAHLFTIITQHADLVEEPDMPACLMQLCQHVADYRPIVARWEAGDFSVQASSVPFPSHELNEYAAGRFQRLKARQARLLGRKEDVPRWPPLEVLLWEPLPPLGGSLPGGRPARIARM